MSFSSNRGERGHKSYFASVSFSFLFFFFFFVLFFAFYYEVPRPVACQLRLDFTAL